jgi:hypothetical protein
MKLPRSLVWLLLVLPGILCAQTGRPDHILRGVIQDQSGAVIPAATVMLKATNGLEIGRTTTDEHGGFTFADLAPGSYQL